MQLSATCVAVTPFSKTNDFFIPISGQQPYYRDMQCNYHSFSCDTYCDCLLLSLLQGHIRELLLACVSIEGYVV
jgi:hypothetical protein